MAIEDFVIQITNEAVLLTIIISLPAVLVSLVVGLAIAIFSATTQIQEQTLSFVPKLLVSLAFWQPPQFGWGPPWFDLLLNVSVPFTKWFRR